MVHHFYFWLKKGGLEDQDYAHLTHLSFLIHSYSGFLLLFYFQTHLFTHTIHSLESASLSVSIQTQEIYIGPG